MPSAAVISAQARSPEALPGVLTVQRLGSDSVLNNRRIAWRSSPTALAVGNYADHLWSASPPEVAQVGIEHCLRAAGAAEFVAPDNAPTEADWILSGRLLHFEQQLTGPEGRAGNAQARVAVDFILTRVRGSRDPVWQDTIDLAVPLPDARPEHVADGIREALARLCPRLVKSLGAAARSRLESCPAAPAARSSAPPADGGLLPLTGEPDVNRRR